MFQLIITHFLCSPFSSVFAKNSNSRPYEITSGNNEVLNNKEKIITVTPHASYIANKNNYEEQSEIKQTTQGSKKTYAEQNHGFKDLQKANQNVENIKFNEDDINKIFDDLDVTTESTTEYESTVSYPKLNNIYSWLFGIFYKQNMSQVKTYQNNDVSLMLFQYQKNCVTLLEVKSNLNLLEAFREMMNSCSCLWNN